MRQGSDDSSHAPPISGCAQISGRPARNRVVFINRRHLKGVVRPSLEKRQAALEHKARSAKSEFRASPPSAPQPPLESMKTTRFLAGLPLENALSSSPFPIEGCEIKDADAPLLASRELNKPQSHARRARQTGKTEAAAKRRCGLPPPNRRRELSRQRAPKPLASSESHHAEVGHPDPDNVRLRQACPEGSRDQARGVCDKQKVNKRDCGGNLEPIVSMKCGECQATQTTRSSGVKSGYRCKSLNWSNVKS